LPARALRDTCGAMASAPLRFASLGFFASLSLTLAACPRAPVQPGHRADGGAGTARTNPSAHTGDAGSDPCSVLSAEQRVLVVARIGETTLTLCDFARRINVQNQYIRARFNAPEQRRALLRTWVDSELLAAEARARGIDQEASVRMSITSQLARQLENDVRAGVAPPEVTEADVERYFQEHRAEYDTPEQVRASHIELRDRVTAERVLADARSHATDDAYWRALVQRESVDTATRDIGGDLGFFAADGGTTVPRAVATAVMALRNPGDVVPTVVESVAAGVTHFHVLRLAARREALHRGIDEVRRPIRNRLWRERFDAAQDRAVQELVQRLRASANVETHLDALAQVHLDDTEGVPPAIPGAGPGQPRTPIVVGAPAAGAPPR